jgi:hypothetical protein
MLSCLKSIFCLRFLQGSNYPDVIVAHRPEVTLDTSRMGQDVVVVKNGRRLCGTGAAVAVRICFFAMRFLDQPLVILECTDCSK